MSDQLFELGGLFATVDTLPTTPIDELSLPREIAPGVIVAPTPDPAAVRSMFAGLGWSTTEPEPTPATRPARITCPGCGDQYHPRATWVTNHDPQCYRCASGTTGPTATVEVLDIATGALF